MHAAFLSAMPQVERLSDYVALTCTNIWRLIIFWGVLFPPPPSLFFLVVFFSPQPLLSTHLSLDKHTV